MAKKRDITEILDEPTPAQRPVVEAFLQTLTMDHHKNEDRSIDEINKIDEAQYLTALALQGHLRSLEHAPQGIKDWHADQKPKIDARNADIDSFTTSQLKLKRKPKDIVDDLFKKWGTKAERGEKSEADRDSHKVGRKWLGARVAKVARSLKAGA